MPASGLVHRILTPSFVDGPGSRMAVFLQGCNLRCRYCHNPETQGVCTTCGSCVPRCPGGALSLGEAGLRFHASRCLACDQCLDACPSWATPRAFCMTAGELLERVRPLEPFLDGLTFSGGECTLQPEFLLEASRLLKANTRLSILLDTNGAVAEDSLETLLGEVDGLLFDFKAMDPDVHLQLTGADNQGILRNLVHAASLGKVAEVRTVVVPGFTDSDAEIRAMARFLTELAFPVPWRLTPFRPQGVRGAGQTTLDPVRFRDLSDLAAGILGPSRIRGGS